MEAYKAWKRFHYFGLPPSVDWRDDDDLFLDVIEIGQQAWILSENWKAAKASKPKINK